MANSSIIIIGAGATGLIAAKELSPHFNVTVLEAEPRTGGRLHSILRHGDLIEVGAEFIHGDLPVTLGLLKDAGIYYVKTEGVMYRKRNGRLIRVDEMTEGWDGLMEKMGALTEDSTMQELLDKYYPGPGNELLCRHVKSYAEGFDLADISRASVKALYREWSSEDYSNYRIPSGYSALAIYLKQLSEKQGAIFYSGKPVTAVQWRPGTVTVQTATGDYTSEKLLVTIPVSVLQQRSSKAYIDFTPPVHEHENIAGDIGFGTVIKVILKFNKSFWPPDTGFILSDELFPTWWTQLPDKIPLLTGWLGGPGAGAMSAEPDEVIMEKVLASLAFIFEKPVAGLRKELEYGLVFNWQKNDYAMGAYSYATIHSEAAKKVMSTPLEGTIFFAGEALYSGDHPGTVEAALVSGIKAAGVIKNTGTIY